MKVLLTGASGLLGKAIKKRLEDEGHSVNILVRKINTASKNDYLWDIQQNYIDEKAFDGIDSIVHLAGSSIFTRWTQENKAEIISSRVDSAALLKQYVAKAGLCLKSYVSASGINYYGSFTSDKILSENDGIIQNDFLSTVCDKWEQSADEFSEVSERVIKLRISPVFSKNGGSLEQLLKITNLNLASSLGSGNQWFPWIHINDLANLFVYAIENENIDGSYNAVADDIPTNKELMKKLARAKKKLFIPISVPSFLLKLALGEMSEMLLQGTRASNEKIKKEGFVFQFSSLDKAISDLLK